MNTFNNCKIEQLATDFRNNVKFNIRKGNKMINLNPINDRIVVERDVVNQTTPGGIVLPADAVALQTTGLVLAVGPGKPLNNGSRQAPLVSVGDRVVFVEYNHVKVDHDGKELLVMREDEVLAVIK